MRGIDFYNKRIKAKFRQADVASLSSRKTIFRNAELLLLRKFTSQKERLWPLKLSLLKKISYFAKMFGMDYLEYIFSKNPEMPYDLFPKSDWQEMDYFLEMILKSALVEGFTEADFYGRWSKFERVRKDVGRRIVYDPLHNSFQLYGFKSIVYPDTGVFPDNYKLDILPKRGFDVCLDFGGYIGDSAYLIDKFLHPRLTYVFEPDPNNYKILTANLRLNNLSKRTVAVKEGVGPRNRLIMLDGSGAEVKIAKGSTGTKASITTIDNYVKNQNIRAVDFIKMDIEGQEFGALKGGTRTIKGYKPDLLIALYHRGEHFFEIPRYLKRLVPEYKFRFLAFSGSSPIIERFLAASTRKFDLKNH